jgi:hypothetical protein
MVDDDAPAEVDEEGSAVCFAAAYKWKMIEKN